MNEIASLKTNADLNVHRRISGVLLVAMLMMYGCVRPKTDEKPMVSITLANGLSIQASQWGPDEATIVRTMNSLLSRKAVKTAVGTAKVRLLNFKVDDSDRAEKSERPPSRYEALLYDDTHEQTLIARGDFDRPEEVDITAWSFQPPPTAEEFRQAVEVLRTDPQLGPQVASGALTPYRAMPGIAEEQLDDGSRRRIITIGLLPEPSEHGATLHHEIIGVSLVNRSIVREPLGGIRIFDTAVCPVPPATGQATVSHASGQINLRVLQNGKTVWSLVVVRPAASSGTRGSGVELRHVYYKGVEVLYRAHVPILNIHYDRDACGPYRDWQNEEGQFEANGTDVAPGFRVCNGPAKTIAESGSDNGNFNGVAIYVEGQDVVLVSEMEAGWYRYISKWRLNTNGTIKPEFGFAATQNSCTCQLHFHNCYWRFDFDIGGPSNDRIDEFNDPAIIAGTNWHAKAFEMERPRSPGNARKWRISDGSRSYTLTPGADDGTADGFARGDLWFLRYHSGEIDDGHNSTGSNCEADITKFDNNENLVGQDGVVWYSAHFKHDATHSHGTTFQGPTLTSAGW